MKNFRYYSDFYFIEFAKCSLREQSCCQQIKGDYLQLFSYQLLFFLIFKNNGKFFLSETIFDYGASLLFLICFFSEEWYFLYNHLYWSITQHISVIFNIYNIILRYCALKFSICRVVKFYIKKVTITILHLLYFHRLLFLKLFQWI